MDPDSSAKGSADSYPYTHCVSAPAPLHVDYPRLLENEGPFDFVHVLTCAPPILVQGTRLQTTETICCCTLNTNPLSTRQSVSTTNLPPTPCC